MLDSNQLADNFLMRILFLRCLIYLLVTISFQARAEYLDIPVSLEVKLDNLLLGHMMYEGQIFISRPDNHINQIDVDFEMVGEKTKSFYKKDLATYFQIYLTYEQLHTRDGVDSNKAIQDAAANDLGLRYVKLLLGKKSARIVPLEGNFSKSRTLQIDFLNLRTSKGVIKQSTSQLQLVDKNNISYLYYSHKNDSKKILVRDIKITLEAFLPAVTRTSITINNGAVQVLRENQVFRVDK